MSGGGGGCNRFKQNAWKKEMCSNCYKTKDEHQDRPRPALPDLPLISPSQSILKGWDRDRKKKRKSVSFPMEECEVIGYGGEELSSDDDFNCDELPSSREESGEEPDGEDDRALNKLTKNNTDFNSVLGNLSGGKSPVQTLLLGAQRQRDTPSVQVTVQPFNNNLANSRKIHLNKLLEDTNRSLTMVPCEKKDEPPHKEIETRKVNITRGSIITKNHESAKNKLYMQNILNGKNDKRNSYNLIQEKVYITTSLCAKSEVREKDENIDYMNGQNKNRVILNCSGASLLGLDKSKDKVLESRELAGEPDGKADSDEAEIPVTPPPRISFLHRDAVEVKRLGEPYEPRRIDTIETLHEIKRSIQPVERRLTSSPETRLNELVEIRRLSVGDCESRHYDAKSCLSDNIEFRKNESVTEQRIETPDKNVCETPENLRRVEPALRRLSDSTDSRRNSEKVDGRRYTDVPESWKVSPDSRRSSVSHDESVKCIKRQAPKPPQCELEGEIEPQLKVESDTASECYERTTLRVEPIETTPVPVRPIRPDSLKISVSTEEAVSPPSSPEPEKIEIPYDVRRNSPKREPPPLPPTTPEPKKSPPEPLPRHNKTTFIEVEKKKTKMKETIKKLLRFGVKEEMDVEVQSPRVRPQIIHPLDLNKSAVQVLPSNNIKAVSADTPSTPTPPPVLPTCRPTKPPPPPRSESLNLMERLKTKPPGSENNIYANLGEARSSITPVKPVRTGSMREAGGKLAVKDQAPLPSNSKTYCSDSSLGLAPCSDQDNLYEAIGSASSAPECDMGQLTYYGSETESDTYSASHHYETADCEGRRGSTVTPYPTIEENFAAVSQLNLQAINHLLTNILERDNLGGSLNLYRMDRSTMQVLCRALFVQANKIRDMAFDSAMKSSSNRVMLAVTPSEFSLILPQSLPVIARFTDSLPQDLLPGQLSDSIGEVTVLACSEVARLIDRQCEDTADSSQAMEQRLLVLLQVLQIIGKIDSRQCSLDNFIVFKDSKKQLSVSYLHKVGDSGEDYWKSSVDELCNNYGIAKALRYRLSTCQTDDEALLAVTSWLYGPPPSLARESLVSWLAVQRAYALRCYLAKCDIAATQHVIFLASNLDLTKLYHESCLLQRSPDAL